jgi:hypothetical protein
MSGIPPSGAQCHVLRQMRFRRLIVRPDGCGMAGMESVSKVTIEVLVRRGWVQETGERIGDCRTYTLTPAGRVWAESTSSRAKS